MRLLFLSNVYPGQFGAIARELASEHECKMLCRHAIADEPEGGLALHPLGAEGEAGSHAHFVTADFEAQVDAADIILESITGLNWQPDVVVNQSGEACALLVRHAFPDCRIITRFRAFWRRRMGTAGFLAHAGEREILAGTTSNAMPLLELHACDAAIVPSTHLHALLPPEFSYKARVLFDGCNTDLYKPTPRDSARVFGEKIDGPVVSFVAPILDGENGLDIFLKTALRIHRHRPNVHFAICGRDPATIRPGEKSIEDRMTQAKYPMHRFRISPPRARSEMAELYSRSDVHIYLSTPGRTPERLIEAMSSESLVLGSDTPPVREYIRHRQNGLLAGYFDVPGMADDAIRALDRPDEFSGMRRNARATVERNLGIPAAVGRFRALLESLGDRLPDQFTADLVSPEAGEA